VYNSSNISRWKWLHYAPLTSVRERTFSELVALLWSDEYLNMRSSTGPDVDYKWWRWGTTVNRVYTSRQSGSLQCPISLTINTAISRGCCCRCPSRDLPFPPINADKCTNYRLPAWNASYELHWPQRVTLNFCARMQKLCNNHVPVEMMPKFKSA